MDKSYRPATRLLRACRLMARDSTHALEDALAELEEGCRAKLYPTGQAAIATVLLAYLRAGDHVLITDAVYEPVRRFCAEHLSRLRIAYTYYGPDGADDAYLVLCGMCTLPLRMAQHARSALRVADFLLGRSEIARVLCPALPGNPSHALWQRDCSGANGLLAIEFASGFDEADAGRMIDSLRLFGIGASWRSATRAASAFSRGRPRSSRSAWRALPPTIGTGCSRPPVRRPNASPIWRKPWGRR